MGNSNIEWTEKTWNPVTGCTKVSEGCRNCYAERMSKRLAGRCGYPEDGFKVTLHPEKLDEPLHWKKPSRIFVCSMGDLFHEDVLWSFIGRVWLVMQRCPQHTFLILTKRPQRLGVITRNNGLFPVLPNLWLGVSVEDQRTADERIPLLLQTPAAKRFVSYEPAIGPVDFTNIRVPFFDVEFRHEYAQSTREQWKFNALVLDCDAHYYNAPSKVDWLIMGGESGPGARPMHPDWARSVRDQCKVTDVPFFFKGWGEWEEVWTENEKISHHKNTMAWLDKFSGWSGGRYGGRDGEKIVHMVCVGKARAGCLLDGKEHKEMGK